MNESGIQQPKNESGSQQAERDFAFRQRFVFGLLIVFIPVLIFFSVKMIASFRVITSYKMLLPLLVIFGLMVLIYLYAAIELLRRKWTTGRFLVTRAEAMAKQDAMWGKLGAGKPLRPQIWFVIFPVIFLAVFLVLAILTFSLLRSFPGPLPHHISIPIVVLIALILLLPAWYIFKTIRRKLKTGSFLLSQEEIAKARARCRKPQPLWLRIFTVAMNVLAAEIMTMIPVVDYLRHRSPEYFWCGMAVFWWLMAAYWIRQVFRPIQPLCALPEAQEEPQAKPKNTGKLVALAILLPTALTLALGFTLAHYVHPTPVIYPPPAQAKVDLGAALQSAAQTHKRILLDFGASWCSDCQALDRYFHDAKNISIVESSFIHVRVNTDNGNSIDCTNANQDLANRYAVPLDKGIPALVVLSDKGELIYSQKNGEFEDMSHLKSSDLTDFLLRWKP
jgi:thiol-disulfide isomerase/thioredoxin